MSQDKAESRQPHSQQSETLEHAEEPGAAPGVSRRFGYASQPAYGHTSQNGYVNGQTGYGFPTESGYSNGGHMYGDAGTPAYSGEIPRPGSSRADPPTSSPEMRGTVGYQGGASGTVRTHGTLRAHDEPALITYAAVEQSAEVEARVKGEADDSEQVGFATESYDPNEILPYGSRYTAVSGEHAAETEPNAHEVRREIDTTRERLRAEMDAVIPRKDIGTFSPPQP